MGKKSKDKPAPAEQPAKTLGEVSSDAARALIDLEAALTAARALVELSMGDGHDMTGPLLYKRLNALEFLLRQAGYAEDVLWVACDKLGFAVDDMAPEPF